ncbi:restriction endonuclease subunit S [Listeria seeligeri]|uniref:restriction endonuclease subunit S n=1 Tax=Listeria seeligeri TaxID=1640 RepID=UPI0022EBF26B|nr:restriction endonuclease subunit S [Listeria seeligeri]
MGLGGIFDAWEQRKLGDVSNYIKGFAFKSKDYKKDGVRIIQVSDLTKDKIKCSNTNIFVSLELAELNKKYRINKNEIIITTVGSKAEIKESAVGRPIIVAEEGHFLLNQNLVKLTSLQGFDNYFIYSQLLQPRYINYIAAIERGNANQANIAIIDLWQYTFLVPKKLEQQKISMFFKQLDNTIALHQRKLDSLKLMKKGFLQLMFPKKGEKAPKLRFADFPDEWEQRKLKEVSNRYDNLRIPVASSKRIKGSTPYYGANGIQDYVEGFTHEGEFILVAEDGANDVQNYPVQYVYGKVWVNNHAHVLQAKVNISDNKFLMNTIQVLNIQPFLVGGGRAKLNSDVMMKLPVKLPIYDEQQKIGTFFKQIDNTITFYQTKVDKLKIIKRTYLKNMFI